jgi:hypothetical protein
MEQSVSKWLTETILVDSKTLAFLSFIASTIFLGLKKEVAKEKERFTYHIGLYLPYLGAS